MSHGATGKSHTVWNRSHTTSMLASKRSTIITGFTPKGTTNAMLNHILALANTCLFRELSVTGRYNHNNTQFNTGSMLLVHNLFQVAQEDKKGL